MSTEPDRQPPGEIQLARHNVVAVFASLDDAERGVEALDRAGIDAADVSILGPRVEREAGREDTTARDEEVAEHVGKRTAAGAAAGTAGGALLGFLGGLAAFAIPGVGPVMGAGIWAATIGGGVAGGAVGGVLGGVSSLGLSRDWELTLAPVMEGKVLVGAHSEDPDVVEKAAAALEGQSPIRMDRLDARGRRTG